eukprot:CAMPEP_0176491426 /NCGR_PEP_ID=MMETSP0200_2-20121128/8423_1 /TAXON_ID=947934 /ORGANISM="Chaetoceros sp., Strain GSL56" /LENGTH=530 /DNA_ID=CAMNT_0017888849 /DNA_START=314 /DNA_END=1903 /DNA_ORIENTATION=-
MFNSILQSGMCNGVNGQCHLSRKDQTCNHPDTGGMKYTLRQGDGWFDSSITLSGRYLIAPQHIQNAIIRQYWAEERMTKQQGFDQKQGPKQHDGTDFEVTVDDYQDICQSLSFSESTLSSSGGSISGSTNAASVSSFDSAVSSIFSALTVLKGNTNRYGIPFRTPSLSLNKRRNLKSTMAMLVSSNVDRYAVPAQDSDEEISFDWDYDLDLTKDTKFHQVPPDSAQVLHLKTCAYMGDFYVKEFLMYSPQYPLPPEIVSKNTLSKEGGMPSISGSTLMDTTSLSPVSDCTISNGIASPIRLAVDNSSFLELALYGSLGLGTARTELSQRASLYENNCKGAYLKDFLVLGNSHSGEPILVSSLKSNRGAPIVRIYATKPRCKTQESIIHSDQLGLTKESYPLFTWAELRREGGEFPPTAETKYFLHTCTGRKNEFHKKPLFTAIHGHEGMMDINVFGHREDNNMNAVGKAFHCARVCVRMDSQTTCTGKSEINYMISIVKDVEIATVLAMVAIIDELVEFSMRKKCAMMAW